MSSSQRRVVIEAVSPSVDGGRFPVKRIIGDEVVVEADLFCDGHEPLAGNLLYRHEQDKQWQQTPLTPLDNDRWRGSFRVSRLGIYRYTVEGWRASDPTSQDRFEQEFQVIVDRPRARFGSWYELFAHSCALPGAKYGSFDGVIERLPYIASMGFDVLYLPPIHPIGRTHRKGKNNSQAATAEDPGSPWGIGAAEGGHKAIHPALGTLDDFKRLIFKAKELDIEIAMDLAFQCSRNHPYIKRHKNWFKWRADGTIQYAENPPKKYEDIVPLDFDSPDWKRLWEELKSVVLYWIQQGVLIFRVDNPHTKPFDFWEWLIREIKKEHPEVIFLSEAFTSPKPMMRLAKLGFSQSYTYFTWRNTKQELEQYFTELGLSPTKEFFRPALWPNTPDILHASLQTGGRGAFAVRLILAATLSGSYGIYGPAYELFENQPREPGSEEYLNSEKYEIKSWDLNRADSLKGLIAQVNRIRREHPALQTHEGVQFHPVDNQNLICYSRTHGADRLLVVVNLDPHNTQSGTVDLRADVLGIQAAEPLQLTDLLTGTRYTWGAKRNYVELSPGKGAAHLFSL